MTTITEAQRVALVKAADALWDKASAADTDEETDYYDEPYCVVNDLLDNATIEAEDASPLWRDSDREDWMRDGSIHLELVADPSVTAHSRPWTFVPGTYVAIETTDEMVAVEPEHLPALIAMLQEVQRRIEAGDAL